MDQIIIFILIILASMTVGGIFLVIKGILKKKATIGLLGALLLVIVVLIIWFLLWIISGIHKVGG